MVIVKNSINSLHTKYEDKHKEIYKNNLNGDNNILYVYIQYNHLD